MNDQIVVNIVYGTIEMQQRMVLDGNRMGYESRTVTKDIDGTVTKIGEWNPPLCWIVFAEPARRPWWARLLGVAP
jgi:hypothetical protein